MGLASRGQGARRRRCGDIVDDEQRRDRLATPMRPKGCSGAWASASLALLDNVTTLPASRRLASAQAALATRHILILGQAPSPAVSQTTLPLRTIPISRKIQFPTGAVSLIQPGLTTPVLRVTMQLLNLQGLWGFRN